MEWISLRCKLETCEIDGSKHMEADKCLAAKGNFRVCYQLDMKKNDVDDSADAWKKLGSMIDRQHPKTPKPGHDGLA